MWSSPRITFTDTFLSGMLLCARREFGRAGPYSRHATANCCKTGLKQSGAQEPYSLGALICFPEKINTAEFPDMAKTHLDCLTSRFRLREFLRTHFGFDR